MKYYIIAGEASGDLHGANLMKALYQLRDDIDIRFWGGDLMQDVGGTLIKHYRDLAFMGFWEVAKNIRTILGNIRFCKEDILAFQPDGLILIDYPGFNLRIAKWAKKQGIRVYYYISPQIWAWHSSRVKGIKQSVDKMFVILPFEEAFYQQHNYAVDFVGHPLLDVTNNFQANPNFRIQHGLTDKPIIALLPGSRQQEIKKMLSSMLAITQHFQSYQFIIAGAPSQEMTFYESIIAAHAAVNVHIVENQTYELLSHSTAALVTSGTATLETALFEVPQVVCYKGNPVSYWIAKRLINVNYISLVNLIMDAPIVTELIQQDFNEDNLKTQLTNILTNKNSVALKQAYQVLKEKLGNAGASRKTAQLILEDV